MLSATRFRGRELVSAAMTNSKLLCVFIDPVALLLRLWDRNSASDSQTLNRCLWLHAIHYK